MIENKTLVIIRHAHRNKTYGSEADNGISAKGRRQAHAILKFYEKRFGKSKPLIYSSPKRRCIETVEPIAKKRKVRVEILDTLNEAPTQTELRRKVADFEAFWNESEAKLIVICSHGDWIPAFVEHLTQAKLDLDKGGWLEIEMIDERPQLRWIVQS